MGGVSSAPALRGLTARVHATNSAALVPLRIEQIRRKSTTPYFAGCPRNCSILALSTAGSSPSSERTIRIVLVSMSMLKGATLGEENRPILCSSSRTNGNETEKVDAHCAASFGDAGSLAPFWKMVPRTRKPLLCRWASSFEMDRRSAEPAYSNLQATHQTADD